MWGGLCVVGWVCRGIVGAFVLLGALEQIIEGKLWEFDALGRFCSAMFLRDDLWFVGLLVCWFVGLLVCWFGEGRGLQSAIC